MEAVKCGARVAAAMALRIFGFMKKNKTQPQAGAAPANPAAAEPTVEFEETAVAPAAVPDATVNTRSGAKSPAKKAAPKTAAAKSTAKATPKKAAAKKPSPGKKTAPKKR